MKKLESFKRYFPTFTTQEGESQIDYLRKTVYKSAEQKYGEITEEIRTKIEREIAFYEKADYINCVLVLAELINELRTTDAEFYAEGTQSGSIIYYLLGITEFDPIKYGFIFERYVSEDEIGRSCYPFFCLHASVRNTNKIISAIKNKYGENSILKTRKKEEHYFDAYTEYIVGINLGELNILDDTAPNEMQSNLSGSEAAYLGLFVLTGYKEIILNVLDECKRLVNKEVVFDFEDCTDLSILFTITNVPFTYPVFNEKNPPFTNKKIETTRRHRYNVNSLAAVAGLVSIGFFERPSTDTFFRDYIFYGSLSVNLTYSFQEDEIMIIHNLTGWNLSKCNNVRKLIRKRRDLDKTKAELINAAIENGTKKSSAEGIWSMMSSHTQITKSKTWSMFYAFMLYQAAYFFREHRQEYTKAIDNPINN